MGSDENRPNRWLTWCIYGALVIAIVVPGLVFKEEDFTATWQYWAAIAIMAFGLALLLMFLIATLHRLKNRNGR